MSEETSAGQGGGCLFCKIIAGEIPSKQIYQDENIFAFLDINPRNPGHALVIPKKHYVTLLDMPAKEVGKLFEGVQMVANAVQKGTNAEGLSIAQSNGKAAGQVVNHLHVHIIPRFMSEGPVSLEGVMSVKKMPEEALDKLVTAIKGKMGSSPGSPSGEPKFDF
jgi:histidine triad (HIT) family protein